MDHKQQALAIISRWRHTGESTGDLARVLRGTVPSFVLREMSLELRTPDEVETETFHPGGVAWLFNVAHVDAEHLAKLAPEN